MFDCLGIAALGSCAYNPSNPPNIYFSIGDAIAALSITLIIPQFLKPIYKFRLATNHIQLPYIYGVVFLGTICAFVAAILPNIGIRLEFIFAYPVFWEIIGGVLFLVAFASLVFAAIRPARARRGMYPKFGKAVAHFLAHADKSDQSDLSPDLFRNVEGLIEAAGFIGPHREWSAFFEFQYRREIEDARYAWSVLQLVAEPQLCEILVHRCPWDTAAMLHRIANRKRASEPAKDLIQQIGRQAIISPSSMIAREIGR